MKNIVDMSATYERLRGIESKEDVLAIYSDIKRRDDFVSFAQTFVFDADSRIARNTMWVLTKASDGELQTIYYLLNDLINLSMQSTDSSVRRLSLTIVERLKMKEEDLRTDFLDYCLNHMTDFNEQPAVQALCMKLAFRMSTFYPELIEELKRTIEAMEIYYYTPAVKSVRNRILGGRMG